MLYIPLTYLIAEGIYSLLEAIHRITLKNKMPAIITSLILAIVYTALFSSFELTYMFRSYNKDNVSHFDYGLNECLTIAHSNNAETIYINVLYPVILFEDKIPAPDFVSSVVYKDVHASFLEPESFGNYKLGDFTENTPSDNSIYICKNDDEAAISFFVQNNMKQEEHGTYIIASITQ